MLPLIARPSPARTPTAVDVDLPLDPSQAQPTVKEDLRGTFPGGPTTSYESIWN